MTIAVDISGIKCKMINIIVTTVADIDIFIVDIIIIICNILTILYYCRYHDYSHNYHDLWFGSDTVTNCPVLCNL